MMMRKYWILLLVSVLCLKTSNGQGGVWTWISGDSTLNAPGVYGTQGISSVNNHPPAAYEYSEWMDKQGNFWIYGGTHPQNSDLWKYNPVTNEWTWIKGNALINQAPRFGLQGIPDTANSPGALSYSAVSWVDTSGNLWLFGGGIRNRLWKYDINLNAWAWIKGDTIFIPDGEYGIQGVPGPNNTPGGRVETCSGWTDSLNNLWLFGGQGYDENGNMGLLNDVWKYNISTNEWTWIAGSQFVWFTSNYGIKGTAHWMNDPGARTNHTKWKDLQGNFWILGGFDYSFFFNDVWKYDVSTNLWTWMAGTSVNNSVGNYSTLCNFDAANNPYARMENRSSVTDPCGRFWLFGGLCNGVLGDLWIFDPVQLEWNLVSGSNVQNASGNFGSLGIPAPGNIPPARAGGVAWWGLNNKFYLFAGLGTGIQSFGDLWVFEPESSCSGICNSLPVAIFNATNHVCPGSCLEFTNLSANAITFNWSFPGAIPDTSIDINPTNICYPNPGSYDVRLIATNANGSDTLLLTNYITVYPTPPPQSITQSGDTLFAIAGSASYQWYFDGNLINGATDYFYVAQASGNYNVIVTDANGCEVEAAIFNVIASAQAAVGSGSMQLVVFPNPVEEKLLVKSDLLNEIGPEIFIYDLLGEKVLVVQPQTSDLKPETALDVRTLPPGMYMIELITAEKTFRAKFVKQ